MKITNSMLNNPKLTQLECYYKIIEDLKSTISKNENDIIKIEFDNTERIKFIHPLFLVYILNFHELLQSSEKYHSQDIRIILNIESLDSSVQKYIHTYLTQYIDCQVILVVDSQFQNKDKEPSVFTDKKILLYTTEKENNLTLLRKQKYNFLPIIKIANNIFNEDFNDKDYWTRNRETNKSEEISNFENRKIFYKSLQLETIEKGAYKNKSDKVWTEIFEMYLELTQNGAYITSKFKEIFREIVENIQKHTRVNDTSANGYISFYINSSQNLYELIVSDDYENGFLSKYYETICDEILKEKKDSIAWKDYDITIKKFEKKEYKHILENIFNLKYVLSAQSERMTKHFGMPLLLKIVNQLKKLSVEKYNTNSLVNLEMYLNKNELSFLVKYDNNNNVIVEQLPDNVVRGTYIHLSFPQYLHLDNPVLSTQKPLKLTSKYYKEILEDKDKLFEKYLLNFQYYFDLKDQNKLSENINAVVLDYSKIQDTSNFLRDLYSFAFLHSVQDILIVNYPIEDNIEYLKILSETTDLSKICNIAFLNKEYPQVLFLGGNSFQDMCDINAMLSQTYNYNKRNFLETIQFNESINISSNLFYTNNEKKQIFFPFELFLPSPTIKNELLYTLMLDNFLELDENYEDIHLDLKDDFHIKKFYYLKNVFETSQWIKLMSFDLAKRIKTKYEKFENIIFVGIEKYSSSFIAQLEYLFGINLKSYIVSDLNSKPILQQFDKFKELHKDKKFIFIRPSVFESNINMLSNDIINYEKYTLIQLTKDGNITNDWIDSYSKNLENVLELASNCSMCFETNEPLYEIDSDKYNIKDLYNTHDAYKNEDKIFDVSWKDAIYFPHIQRNTNHYLYYIRTTQFFKNNKDDIKEYYKKLKFERDEKVPVILTSAHNTNAEFIALVNEIVFENDAIVHSLCLNNKEQGYFSINNLTNTYKNKEDYYSFYFVDDAISSGEAFKYIYSVLSSFFNDSFQAVFTLIDRTNEKDLKLFRTYSKEFDSYLKINIHPIKTGFENCYLCDRKKVFEKIAINSSLVTIKHTFQKKAKDLAIKNANDIEYESLKPIDDLKNYLRMSSTEYIYQHIDEFNKLENIEIGIDNYYNYVAKNYFEKNYLNGQSPIFERENFLKVESRIAFLKSLAFPKVYFFKTLRKNIHKHIYEEIRKFTDINQNGKKIIIKPLLSENDSTILEQYELKELVKYYENKKRTNMHYFSFLLSLGSYLGINHILSYEVIIYYYNLTLEIKKAKNYDYRNLLNAYPIAIKQLTSYSKAKSKYFEQEFAKFYKDFPFEYTRIFSRIFGLFVENTIHLKKDENIFQNITNEKSIDEKIIIFKTELEKIISVDIKSICIDLNENIDNSLLVDILNEYKELDNGSTEEIMYKGAFVKKEINDKKIIIENREEKEDNKKYNIWCNFYQDFKTYIRITNSDDKLTPIGVIVIEHKKNNNLNEHLKISRWILAYENIICKLFNKSNYLSAMRTKYDEIFEKNNIEKENEITKLKQKHQNAKSSHGAIDNMRRCIENFEGNNKTFYNGWLTYCNLLIGKLYTSEIDINIFTDDMIESEFLDKFVRYSNAISEVEHFEIDNNMQKEDLSEINIKSLYLVVFMTLLVDNARQHGDKKSKLYISTNVNCIIIKNFVSEDIDIDDVVNRIQVRMIKEPWTYLSGNDKNPGITLYTMNKYLNNDKYSFVVAKNKNSIEIKIERKIV